MKTNSNINKIIFTIIIAFILSGGINACFIVKYSNSDDIAPQITLSPKPEMQMNSEIVRSASGDMIASIPEEWFFVDMENKLDMEIVAVAVNPKYNMSLVFAKLPKSAKFAKIEDDDDLINLARYSLKNHQKKSKRALKLSNKYRIIKAGTMKFASYGYSTTGAISVKSVVFRSQLGNLYELALVPMIVNGNLVPEAAEMEKVFNSVVATIQY